MRRWPVIGDWVTPIEGGQAQMVVAFRNDQPASGWRIIACRGYGSTGKVHETSAHMSGYRRACKDEIPR